jgi:hypothetical protein
MFYLRGLSSHHYNRDDCHIQIDVLDVMVKGSWNKSFLCPSESTAIFRSIYSEVSQVDLRGSLSCRTTGAGTDQTYVTIDVNDFAYSNFCSTKNRTTYGIASLAFVDSH